MGMPYYDPEKAGDGPDAPDGPLGLEPGDLVVVASAGIWMLPETTTETVLRNAVEAGGNPPRKC